MNPTISDHQTAIQRVIDYVEENVAMALDLDDLCRVAAMSRYHFCRLFRVYSGMPPSEYVRRRKAIQAAELIADGRAIVDVAVGLGYGSHSAFSRAFRRTMGTTPTAWVRHGGSFPGGKIVVRTRRFEEDNHTMAAYETEHVILRTFRVDDWRQIQALAVDKEKSPAAHLDQKWPTSDKECQTIAAHFAGNESFWAICPKETNTIVGIIVFNGVDDHRTLDLGHLVRTEYAGSPLITEALCRMVQFAFDDLDVDRIVAHNAIAWKGQTEPLTEIGFTEVGSGTAAFADRPDGTSIEFMAITVEMTRRRWGVLSGEPDSPGRAGDIVG
jgi:AraC-like DNA-binding protein